MPAIGNNQQSVGQQQVRSHQSQPRLEPPASLFHSLPPLHTLDLSGPRVNHGLARGQRTNWHPQQLPNLGMQWSTCKEFKNKVPSGVIRRLSSRSTTLSEMQARRQMLFLGAHPSSTACAFSLKRHNRAFPPFQ